MLNSITFAPPPPHPPVAAGGTNCHEGPGESDEEKSGSKRRRLEKKEKQKKITRVLKGKGTATDYHDVYGDKVCFVFLFVHASRVYDVSCQAERDYPSPTDEMSGPRRGGDPRERSADSNQGKASVLPLVLLVLL